MTRPKQSLLDELDLVVVPAAQASDSISTGFTITVPDSDPSISITLPLPPTLPFTVTVMVGA